MRLQDVRIGQGARIGAVLRIWLAVAAVLSPCAALAQASVAPQGGFQASFTAGSLDAEGRFMGGTELRILAAHGGKLFAGNGFWKDEPGPEGPQGAEILVLDRPDGAWRVDHAFGEWMRSGRPHHLAVSALREVVFTTDGMGARLAAPVAMLVASTWDLGGATGVFSREDATGAWTFAAIADDLRAPGGKDLPQVRSLGVHTDRVTGVDHVFAGQNPHGIFGGTYDPDAPGRIRWGARPEFDLSTLAGADSPELKGQLRVTSFAECGGRLYAAVGQQVYVRVDGAEPSWRLLYANSRPGRSQTGLRGLTAVAGPDGRGAVLMAAVEGTVARIMRIDPDDGSEVTELALQDFLAKAWGMPVGYAISAYNDMAVVRGPDGEEDVLIGFQTFIPPNAALAPGHGVVDVGYGRLEEGAWYLIRRPGGRYEVRRIPAFPGRAPLVATRTILASPFAGDGDALYFGGYDANRAPAHNTAWIVRTTRAVATGAPK